MKSVEVSDYINVRARALELDCDVPTGLSLLPRNFDIASSKQDLFHDSSFREVRSLWRGAGIEETRLEGPGKNFAYVLHQTADWIGPIIFVSSSLLTQNPSLVSVALGVVANSVTDFFKGLPQLGQKVSLDIVIESAPDRQYKRVHYEGPPDGLSELPKI